MSPIARPCGLAHTTAQNAGALLLILKLIVVPLAVLLLGVTERVHGPRAAGWLSGFPVIAAPLLLLVTMEQGVPFGAAAAKAAFFGLVPWLTFVTTYGWCAQSRGWVPAALASFLVWGAMALLVVTVQGRSPLLELIPFIIALLAVSFHSRVKLSDEQREFSWSRLAVRMIAGAALTFAVAQLAGALGPRWSGTFTTFPVVGSIVAISNHVEHGPRAVQEAVSGMALGVVPIAIFCFGVFHLLGHGSLWLAFGVPLAAAMLAQALTLLIVQKIR